MGHDRGRRHVVRRALVHRDPADLLPQGPRREGRRDARGRLEPGRPQGLRQGHAGQGRRQVGHLPAAGWPGLVADVHAVRLAEGRRAGRRRQVHVQHRADAGGAGLLRVVLRARRSRRPTCRRGRAGAGFIKGDIGAFVSGPWHMGILRDQGGEEFDEQVGRRADARRRRPARRSPAAATWWSSRTPRTATPRGSSSTS